MRTTCGITSPTKPMAPAHRDHHPGEQRQHDEQPEAQPPDIDAERRRRFVADQQCIELPAVERQVAGADDAAPLPAARGPLQAVPPRLPSIHSMAVRASSRFSEVRTMRLVSPDSE
jgi:hypothetical protein